MNATAPTGKIQSFPPITTSNGSTATVDSTVASGTVGPKSPTQSGTASNCVEYYLVSSGDSCAKLERLYGISFAQLYKWNPAIGSNCESLWVGYAVCVAVSS